MNMVGMFMATVAASTISVSASAAPTPPAETITAAGFGVAEVNGTYELYSYTAGKKNYLKSGGTYGSSPYMYFVEAAGGFYLLKDSAQNPRYATDTATTPFVTWYPNDGSASPAGTVSAA